MAAMSFHLLDLAKAYATTSANAPHDIIIAMKKSLPCDDPRERLNIAYGIHADVGPRKRISPASAIELCFQ